MRLIVEDAKSDTVLPRVMRAAVGLFVAKGIDGTTIKDIAQKSRVSEGALYRHFKSKEALAYHLFSTHVNDFTLELTARVAEAPGARAKVRAYVAACFEAFENERDLFTFLILSEHRELDRFPETHRHPGHLALELVAEAQKRKEMRPMDVTIGASLLVGGIIRVCLGRIRGGLARDLRKETDTVAEALWRALKK